MGAPVIEAANYLDISATTNVTSGPGKLVGIFVASTTSGTIKIWDNNAASGPVIANTFTPAAATFYPMPALYRNGIFITLANTIDCTVFYDPSGV